MHQHVRPSLDAAQKEKMRRAKRVDFCAYIYAYTISIYISRSIERRCAGEKTEHQNVNKRHSSSKPPTTTTPPTASNIIFGWNLYAVNWMMLLLPQRVAIIVTKRTRPRQTRHGPSDGIGVAQSPPSCQLAGKQGGTCIFWPRCFY